MAVIGRQVLHLLLGDAQLDTAVEPSHIPERDSHFLASPQMPLLEEHVCHLVAGRIDAERMDLPDITIGGVDVVTAAFLHLASRGEVDGLPLRDSRDLVAVHDRCAARVSPAGCEHLYRDVVANDEFRQCLFGRAEIPELRLSAAERDPARGRVDHVQRNKPGEPYPALRLDHEMGDGAGGGVDDHGLHLAAEPVGTVSVTSDYERYLCQ